MAEEEKQEGQQEQQEQQEQPTAPSGGGGGEKSTTGMDANVAAMLAWLSLIIGIPLGGIIFLLMKEENRLVRFHSIQSIVYSVVVWVVYIAAGIIGTFLGAITAGLGCVTGILFPILGIVFFIFWIMATIKAYQGEMYKLPVIGDQAEKYV